MDSPFVILQVLFVDLVTSSFFRSRLVGTLNPALQDRQGRPKRDISTIIHILNDLLCATPQYRRVLSAHAAAAAAAAAAATTPSTTPVPSSGSAKPSTSSSVPMEQDEAADLVAASATAAAAHMAAALHRKTPGKAGLPTLLLLRGDLLQTLQRHVHALL